MPSEARHSFFFRNSSGSLRHSEKKSSRTSFFRSSDVESPAGDADMRDAKQHHWVLNANFN